MLQYEHVGHVGGRSLDRVDDLDLVAHSDVRIHAEIPPLALGGPVHPGVAPTGPALRRTRHADDRGVHDGAAPDLDPISPADRRSSP